MSVAVSARSWHVCVCLNCSCQSSSIRRVNKSRQGFSKAGGGKKSHHKSAPLGSSAITFCKWSSVFPVSRSPSVQAVCTYTVSTKQHRPLFGRCEAVYLCCCVDWWGGWGWGRGMMWIVGSITVERGVSPRRRLTEFDKAVSAERP